MYQSILVVRKSCFKAFNTFRTNALKAVFNTGKTFITDTLDFYKKAVADASKGKLESALSFLNPLTMNFKFAQFSLDKHYKGGSNQFISDSKNPTTYKTIGATVAQTLFTAHTIADWNAGNYGGAIARGVGEIAGGISGARAITKGVSLLGKFGTSLAQDSQVLNEVKVRPGLVNQDPNIVKQGAKNTVEEIVNNDTQNAALFEKYKYQLVKSEISQLNPNIKPHVADIDLQDFVRELYKGVDSPVKYGSGTTADAIRYEKTTGNRVYGRLHSQKGEDRLRGLDRWLKNHPHATEYDKAAARMMIDDLKDALKN